MVGNILKLKNVFGITFCVYYLTTALFKVFSKTKY